MTDFVIFKVAEDGEILEDITDVTEGSSFEDGLFQVPVFPPDTVTQTGEESGTGVLNRK